MLDVMLALGNFRFSLDTAAYNELQRSTGFTWADQARIGTNPALQFTGKEAETINLKGLIIPEYKGGLGQLKDMRKIGHEGKPLKLVSGTGEYLGEWVITNITETQNVFGQAGTPRKVEFGIALKRYDDPTLKSSSGSQFTD